MSKSKRNNRRVLFAVALCNDLRCKRQTRLARQKALRKAGPVETPAAVRRLRFLRGAAV